MATRPTPGSAAEGSATIAANVGIRIAARASFSWSAAVETVSSLNPLGSVYVVERIPSALAVAFMRATNAAVPPAS